MQAKTEVSKEEWAARVDLAAVYRLCVHYGWSEHIYNHIALRVPDEPDCFLVKKHRLLYEEVCASNLMKLRLDGKPLPGQEKVNPAGFTIHTAVLKARSDVNCTLHFHTISGMAVSALPEGLQPMVQGDMRFYNRLSYHDFEGLATDQDETARLQRDLGPKNKAIILRNHGLVTCGVDTGEALTLARYLDTSCKVQMALLASGRELRVPPAEVCERTAQQYEKWQASDGAAEDWPAYIRMADRLDSSFRN
jgi:ribulose-5-phosphate 4-epimerase/fuculose-1-phosphate aldolase